MKGELMEELVRNYFLNAGYFVVRSVKFKYEGIDITDVDIYLYLRTSSSTRQRINVDLKNRVKPQTFERILWANGLKALLGFDSCIVATTDQRPVIHTFGQLHDTLILDGAFLSRLKTAPAQPRLYEEHLITELIKQKSLKSFPGKDWRHLYEESKSKLLSEQDFAGFNDVLIILKYFLEKVIYDKQRQDLAIRMVYLLTSHLLVIIDFIVKDVVFLAQESRDKKLSDGFAFGNLGRAGVDKIISIASQMSGKNASEFRKSLEDVPSAILKDYFIKSENTKSLFVHARDFETLGFKQEIERPDKLDSPLKGVLSVLLDFHRIERKKFFDLFGATSS